MGGRKGLEQAYAELRERHGRELADLAEVHGAELATKEGEALEREREAAGSRRRPPSAGVAGVSGDIVVGTGSSTEGSSGNVDVLTLSLVGRLLPLQGDATEREREREREREGGREGESVCKSRWHKF